MSETPTVTLTDTDRDRLFDTWLKPIKPAKIRAETIVEKLAPWRHHFTDAIAAGYTWDQLATEVATKPELGLTLSGLHLKHSIYAAFKAAGETVPGSSKAKRRRNRTRPATPAAKPPATTLGTT